MPVTAPTPELIAALAEQAHPVMEAIGVTTAAVSWWDREAGTMRTVLNVGQLHPSESPFPADEAYPLDAFPAVDALLRFGRPYIDPPDVSSSAVLAHLRHRSQGAVPIVCEGEVWGELWAASIERRLEPRDLPELSACAHRIGRLLASH